MRVVDILPEHTSFAVQRLRLRPARRREPVVHPSAALVTLTEGAAAYWSRGTYRLGRGDVLLLPEGTPHYLVESERAEVVGASLCTSCLERWRGGQLLAETLREVMRGASAVRRLDEPDRASVLGALQGLQRELDARRSGAELAVEAHLTLIGVALHRATAAPALQDHTVGPSLAARALAFVSARALDGISLADVARHVGRSPTHTADTVKAQTGRTVGEWILDARLAVARELLRSTEESVEAVGLRVGFSSRSHFHRAFKRTHGVAPSAWRGAHVLQSGSASSAMER